MYTQRCWNVLYVMECCLFEMLEVGFDDGFERVKMGMEVFYFVW